MERGHPGAGTRVFRIARIVIIASPSLKTRGYYRLAGKMPALPEEGQGMSANESSTHEVEPTKYPWAGPALFTSVLIAVIVFFVWFLRA